MKNYTNTDQQLHVLCQIITKANRTFVPKKDDDSHTNLAFNSAKNRIEGRWINSTRGKIIMNLNLASLRFEWVNEQEEVLESFPSLGKTIKQIEVQISEGLSVLGLSKTGFTYELHFEIPAYPFADKPIQIISAEDLTTWKNYRKLANEACSNLLSKLNIESEIRIWPHHFDTGIYIEPSNEIGLGFGLAMEDSMVGSSYFYYSAYGLNGYNFEYPTDKKLEIGKWIVNENWQGAVLPLEDLQENDTEKLTLFVTEVSICFLQEA
jgi:hypothetical protein